MKPHRWLISVGLVGIGLSVGILSLWPRSSNRAAAPSSAGAETNPTRSAAPLSPRAQDSLARLLVAAGPFRRARRPAPQSYRLDAVAPAALAGPALLRPILRLTGVVLGSRPVAVIEGIPGASGGRVLAVGDTLGGLRLQRILARSATLVGFDTTWTLTISGDGHP